jgi:hypothetical protein
MNQHRKELTGTEGNKQIEIRIDDEFRLPLARCLKCGGGCAETVQAQKY